MTTKAPTITSKGGGRWLYPAPGTSIASAWELTWTQLGLADEPWTDGTSLAQYVAEETGLHADTIKNLLNSARRAGLLEAMPRAVRVEGRTGRGSGPRTRTHYRIAAR